MAEVESLLSFYIYMFIVCGGAFLFFGGRKALGLWLRLAIIFLVELFAAYLFAAYFFRNFVT